ncbi:MAG: DUF6320 domain-containing protein [Christensenella sp.]|uniref:DUF6320 domain-containing protein n=1 Tax=Christensenella sp. TaxID=1935934 RepID=UPI002B20277B|nr:DUF6320 domain-containing protein [Christensenella sp.]MEA5004735.1 DUF6320 domain-containing protein [Christensenella sp.]
MEHKMNFCDECCVYVDDCFEHCPLCGKQLTAKPAENELYPPISRKKYVDHHSLVMDYLLLATFVVITLCVAINIFTWNGTPWFLAVAAPTLYAWVLVKGTILSDWFAGAKVLLQMVTLIAMFMAFDFVGSRSGWSYQYMMPLILSLGIAYIDIYSYNHKSHWRGNMVYAILFVALGFIPLILHLSGVKQGFFLMILSTFASGITILGLLRFALRYFKAEMQKRFHM